MLRASSVMFLGLLLLAPAALAEKAAEIVSLKGKGEYREPEASDWRPAVVKQVLESGQYVRTTQPESKMGVLLTNETVLTIQGVSILQVKAPEPGQPRKSILEFGKGTGRFETKTPTKDFAVRTPTGIAAIRGTEWLVVVDDDGRSAFTVVEGEIEISNELGSLAVAANEEGVLEKGKAPFKRRVQNARERVQWVSAFTIDPSRYLELRSETAEAKRLAPALDALRSGEISRARDLLTSGLSKDADIPAAYFLLAEIEIYFGHMREATQWLAKAEARFPTEPRTAGLLARTHLFADDFPAAREAASRAAAKSPDNIETLLAVGEVARLDGEYERARAALTKATEVAPQDWRAWHALGQMYGERSDPRRARPALGKADSLSPNNAQVLGEIGLVEANAYDLPQARTVLGRSLEVQPDDFASWTGLGLARLKSGDLDGALEALLKATLIEPRYARAHVYLAVVYWQQRRFDDAFDRLRTASLHDPRDPLPYQFAAMMHSDLLRPGDALADARQSVARLKYVKSLDAIANDLRGGANLGAPLAQLGFESWALKVAQDTFDPLWAGSHLFLGDRLPGKFMSNSEFAQGFITDPLAFGASNRFQTLVSRVGYYGTLAWRGARDSLTRLTEPLANVNGLTAEGRVAYFAEAVKLRAWFVDGSGKDEAPSYTLGFGWKPRDDIGLFLYANRFEPDNRAGFTGRSIFDPFQVTNGDVQRIDAGMHYRPGPDWQVWLAGGHGWEDTQQTGRDVGTSGAAQVLRDFDFTTQPKESDIGARALHRAASGMETWFSAEGARWTSVDFLERDAFFRPSPTSPRLLESVRQDIRDESKSFAAGLRWQLTPRFLVEADVDWSSYEKTDDILVRRDFINQSVAITEKYDRDQWSPRAGAVFKPIPELTFRAAYQKWLRPTSPGTLKPVSTAGIVLDDRFVLAAGRFERARGQVEWEAMPKLFFSVFADHQEIDNLYSPLIGVLNFRPDSSNLQRLRNRSFNSLASLGTLEGDPVLSKGNLREYGGAVNALVTRQLSLFAEAVSSDSENTGTYPGARFMFLPKERYSIGGTFFSDHRWSLSAKAVRRGDRFADEANRIPLPAEWVGVVQGYWESPDKRWSVEPLVNNLGTKTADRSYALAINFRF